MDLFTITSDLLFPIASDQNAQREQFAMQYLQQGLQAYTDKNYDKAISLLNSAVGLAPQSTTALNAYQYVAQSYVQQGKTQAAIDTYGKMITANPYDDTTHVSLANLYYSNNQFDKARTEYETAVKLNPSAVNRYSLGQGYMAGGRFNDALQQFKMVQQQSPTEPQGSFGMGQAYAKMGKYDDAIRAFGNAISIKKNYWDAYAEMGYVYMDSGNSSKATEIAKQLSGNDATKSQLLSEYISGKTSPQIMAAYPTSSPGSTLSPFLSIFGPHTQLSTMSGYLSTAGSEQAFSLNFTFSKPMDRNSVENVQNWSISKAVGTGFGDGYNLNQPPPSTEVTLPSHPYAVSYNASSQTATVLFKISQNATANGTIDPRHINFSFAGVDQKGLTMDPKADTYSGYSGIA